MLSKIKSFFLENSTTRQTVIKNTFWLSTGQIVSRLLRALIIIYAARILGTASYGVFSYTLSLAGLFAIFSDIGLTSLLTREAAKNSPTYRSYLAVSLFVKLALVALSMALIVFLAPVFTTIPEAHALLPFAAFLLAFDSLRDFTFALSRARQVMQKEAVITIATNLAVAVFAFAALFLAPSSRSLTIAYTAGSAFGLLLAFTTIGREFRERSLINRGVFIALIKDAWPFALLGLLSGIMVSMDTLMLGWFKGASDVGLYGAAQRPILLFYALPSLFATSLFPLFAKYAATEKERFRVILETSLTASLAVVIPLVLGGIIVSKDLILLIYGSEFLAAAPAFSILLLTLPIVFPSFIIGDAIVSYNGQRTFFLYNTLGAVGDIILNILLIPTYGIMGAAISTVGAQAITNLIVWYKLKRLNPFSVMPRLPKIVLAALVMAGVTLLLSSAGIPVLVIILVSACLYPGLLYVLKEPLLREVKKTLLFK